VRDLRGWRFDGTKPCRSMDFMLIDVTWESELHETPNHLHGFGSVGFHELRDVLVVLSV
jgi:hypothetical protein